MIFLEAERPDARRLYFRKYSKQYRKDFPKKHLIYIARARAKRKNLEFSITEEDIILPEVCPYLGIPLKSTCSKHEKRGNIYTLDRIDNSLGYIPGNVEVISWQANTMKSNSSKEELLSFAREVIRRNDIPRLRDNNMEQGKSL